MPKLKFPLNGPVLLCAGMVLFCFLSTSFSANMTPIAATGWNRDIVVENTSVGPPYTTGLNLNSGEQNAFYQTNLAGKSFGLPLSGSFTSAVDSATVFQLQPYTSSNALVL